MSGARATRAVVIAWAMALGVAPSVVAGCHLRSASSSDNGGGDASDLPDVDLATPAGQGALAVFRRNCAACHQSPLPGAGVLAGQDTPVPGTRAYGSNLTPDPETGLDLQEAGTIADLVLQAVDLKGTPLCPAMPVYGDAGMAATEARSIAAYLQTLTPVWHPVPPSQCGLAIDAGAVPGAGEDSGVTGPVYGGK